MSDSYPSPKSKTSAPEIGPRMRATDCFSLEPGTHCVPQMKYKMQTPKLGIGSGEHPTLIWMLNR